MVNNYLQVTHKRTLLLSLQIVLGFITTILGGYAGIRLQWMCYNSMDRLLSHPHSYLIDHNLFGGLSGMYTALYVICKGALAGGGTALSFVLSRFVSRRIGVRICLGMAVIVLFMLPGRTGSKHEYMLSFTFPLLCAAALVSRGLWLLWQATKAND